MKLLKKLNYLITFFLFIINYQVLHSNEVSLFSEEKLDINAKVAHGIFILPPKEEATE